MTMSKVKYIERLDSYNPNGSVYTTAWIQCVKNYRRTLCIRCQFQSVETYKTLSLFPCKLADTPRAGPRYGGRPGNVNILAPRGC